MIRPTAPIPVEKHSGVPRSDASPGLAAGERWFVVQTRARDEHRAQMHLSQQKYRTFLPTVVRAVRHARKVRNVQAAVFPGYLFVVLDLARDRFRSINGTRGVSRLVTFEAAPVAVPHGVVETLLRRDGRLPF
jgi:transcriptional antiterminator RfaH